MGGRQPNEARVLAGREVREGKGHDLSVGGFRGPVRWVVAPGRCCVCRHGDWAGSASARSALQTNCYPENL
jgi:hypothetical protein